MKRKFLIVLLSIVCALCLAFGLTACGDGIGGSTDSGEQTGNTDDGSSGSNDDTEQSDETEHTHTPSEAVIENEVAATCGTNGSYDSVVYCKTCGEEISRDPIIVEATGEHTYGDDGKCMVCGTRKPSEGLAYTISDDGTYYIVSGIGTCTDTDIVFPSTYKELPVTVIAERAFENQTQIISIYVPKSVTAIGEGAFSGCSSLVSITLPFVGYSASATSASSSTLFGYIFGNSSYTGGTSTKQYYASSSYETYYIPDTLTTVVITGGNILYGAFYGCKLLSSITIPDSVTSIDAWAFCNVSLTSVTIPDSVTSIGNYAFYRCFSLTSIVIPDSVSSIGGYAFYGCTKLTNITIGSGVTSIGYMAFYNTGYYKDTNNWEDDVLYIGNYLIKANTSISGSYTIKDGTMVIADYAFYRCTSLTSITISDSVTFIGNFAFSSCTSLESVTFENTSGWYVTETEGDTSGTGIISSDLENTSTAATYLMDTYKRYYWYRSEN